MSLGQAGQYSICPHFFSILTLTSLTGSVGFRRTWAAGERRAETLSCALQAGTSTGAAP